jgi:small-conductance mechanosensitive channel
VNKNFFSVHGFIGLATGLCLILALFYIGDALAQGTSSEHNKSDRIEVREREGGLVPIFFRAYNKSSVAFSRMGSLLRDAKDHSTEWATILEKLSYGKGWRFLLLRLLSFVLIVFVGLTAEMFLRRSIQDLHDQLLASVPIGRLQRIGQIAFGMVLQALRVAAYVLTTFALFVLIFRNERQGYILVAHCLLGSYYFRLIALAAKILLSPQDAAMRILPMKDVDAVFLYRWIVRMALIATVIVVASIIFREGGMGPTLFFMVYSLSGLSVGLAALIMIWQSRARIGQALMTAAADHVAKPLLHSKLARTWHWFAMIYVIGITISWQASLMLEGRGRIIELFYGLFLIPVFLGLDHWGQKVLQTLGGELNETKARVESDPERTEKKSNFIFFLPFLQRLLRVLLVTLLFFIVLKLWGIDLPLGRVFTSHALSIIVVLLLGFLIWQFVKVRIDRRLREELPETKDEMEEGGAGGSRAGTLLMLLRKFVLSVLFVVVTLIILSSIGINIGPLIAGAGVIGLAIGFGAQTLVKDIISGVFFLMDDAFRVGDYVECGSAKGTVVQISLRSLTLRHPRGQLYVLPFGDIGSVTNLSRDYVIMKLDFRVRYDADQEKIRKIIKKKVYQPIMDNPELGPKLLEPIKSQGVREMDDSAMIMRVKYKTKPGDQFGIRREVYRLMQEAFKEEGIEFAHRNVTVYMPPEVRREASGGSGDTGTQSAKSDSEVQRQAAAAAALSVIQAEEEAAKLAAAQKPKK